jgi:hypothetical protein
LTTFVSFEPEAAGAPLEDSHGHGIAAQEVIVESFDGDLVNRIPVANEERS